MEEIIISVVVYFIGIMVGIQLGFKAGMILSTDKLLGLIKILKKINISLKLEGKSIDNFTDEELLDKINKVMEN